MGQSAATKPGAKGGSVFDQSAAGLANAGKATLGAGQGFASIANSKTGGLGSTAGQTYNPATMKHAYYDAATQADPAKIRAGIAGYMNPYTSDVINRTQADIQRQTQMGLRDLGSTASGQGAFGGSRHGIAEGTAIGEGSKALGDISAQMRAEGYNTAAGLAGQDVANQMTVAGANQAARNAQRQYNAGNLQGAREYNATAANTARQYNAGARTSNANQAIENRLRALQGLQSSGAQGASLAGQGMGIGQGLSGQQDAYGQQIGGINSSLISQAAGMFDRYTGQPLESTAAILNLLSGNPLSGTGKTTQTNTPGTKSQLSSALGIAARVP